MTPIQTATTDTLLVMPPDADRYDDADLPVRVVGEVTYSYWRPNPMELLDIIRGRPIRLGVVGQGHPSVSLDMEE